MRPGGEGVDRGALAIQPVTAERLPAVLALRVAPGQEGFIETTAQCLAEAAEEPTWWPVALCDGGQVVGFAMYGRFRNRRRVWLDRLLVDRAYQGRGYGRAFLGLLLERLFAEYRCDSIYLSLFDDNRQALALYKSFGFVSTGERDTGGEAVMRLRRTP